MVWMTTLGINHEVHVPQNYRSWCVLIRSGIPTWDTPECRGVRDHGRTFGREPVGL